MWLLDANMPIQLGPLLRDLGIEVDSAWARGWNELSNGELVSTAVKAGFTVLLTRDRSFGESAARALKVHRQFSVVRITLPQLRADQFIVAFRFAWETTRLVPHPGS
ncbi:MAG: DUF5615 family PIN-like protein [Deltaproteobacteria bacterium]|nr:DUF5615 family PIN-like protein [Deltaproteobacteria bacterium]